MNDSDRDGIRLHYDFDVPHHVLLSMKVGDVEPVLRLTVEEARTLARRLNGVADAIEPSSGAERLGKPVRVLNDPACPKMAPRYEAVDA